MGRPGRDHRSELEVLLDDSEKLLGVKLPPKVANSRTAKPYKLAVSVSLPEDLVTWVNQYGDSQGLRRSAVFEILLVRAKTQVEAEEAKAKRGSR